jgi:tripartite-type tricarboxylate transporter receptor subunit TctC
MTFTSVEGLSKPLRSRLAFAGIAACAAGAPVAQAADFYAGKKIDLIVGADVGGGYDIYARTIVRFMSKYIPGEPTIVVRNMPGAGSAIAGGQVYNIAPKDGLTIVALMPGAVMGRLIDEKAANLFEPTKFIYLGTADSGVRVCLTFKSSKVKTFEDTFTQQATFGASAAGGSTRDYAAFHSHVNGSKIKIVSGYKGTADIFLAMERGEVDGLCGLDWSSLNAQKPDWLRDKSINLLVQDSLEPEADLTALGVPHIMSFIKDEADKKAVRLIVSQQVFGRSYAVAPGTPADRVKILRDAFMATMADKTFLAEAEKVKITIVPSSGEKVQQVVQDLHASTPDVVKRAKEIIEP